MENSIFLSVSTLLTFSNEGTGSGIILIYILLPVILIFSATTLFIIRYFKNKIKLSQENLNRKIILLREENENLLKKLNAHSAELTVQKEHLAEVENKLQQCIGEKTEMEQVIKSLKDQLKNSHKNDDIIIEYYMNNSKD